MSKENKEPKVENDFRKEVIAILEEQGWQVKKQPRISPVDILATRSDGTRRAFRVTAQGHLYNKDVTALREYGMDNEIDVLHICKAGLEGLRFIRMYPRNIHKYNIKQ
jgi:hypothetical protein